MLTTNNNNAKRGWWTVDNSAKLVRNPTSDSRNPKLERETDTESIVLVELFTATRVASVLASVLHGSWLLKFKVFKR